MKNPIRIRTLVTGGSGFLGSHLCERLLVQANDVLCVDNLFTGAKENVQHLFDHPRFELMRHDVTFPLYVEVDEIYNLAFPVLHRPFTNSLTQFKRQKRACTAPSTCWAWQSG